MWSHVIWLAKPAAFIAAKRNSPEAPRPSPVKTLPVRLPPCAAGASPTTSRRARGSPNPGTGRPQYVSWRKATRFSRATCRQYVRRRGQRSQLMMSWEKCASRSANRRVPLVRLGLLVRVIAAADERARFDVAETERQRVRLQLGELRRRVVA